MAMMIFPFILLFLLLQFFFLLFQMNFCSWVVYRVGHNEVIGVCRVGNDAESLGRDHWGEMLTYPRKPIAHWHPVVEVKLFSFIRLTKT